MDGAPSIHPSSMRGTSFEGGGQHPSVPFLSHPSAQLINTRYQTNKLFLLPIDSNLLAPGEPGLVYPTCHPCLAAALTPAWLPAPLPHSCLEQSPLPRAVPPGHPAWSLSLSLGIPYLPVAQQLGSPASQGVPGLPVHRLCCLPVDTSLIKAALLPAPALY